jgi:hypothetical protein
VAADAPLGADAPLARPRAATHPRALRLAPPVRRPRGAWGDAAFATTLAATLAAGIVGVLLLNTAMQTQADQIAATQHRLTVLHLQLQTAQTAVDRENTPGELAVRATALHMHPAQRMPFVTAARGVPTRLPRAVSAPARANKPAPGG